MDKRKIRKIENALTIIGGISAALGAIVDNRIMWIEENIPEEYRDSIANVYGYLHVKKNTPIKRKIWNGLMILERFSKEERETMNHIF